MHSSWLERGPGTRQRPPRQTPWWKGACSCSTETATASRTTPSATTMTPLCPWIGCDSGACCVTSCSMSPTRKSKRTKWCWLPAAPTSTPCLPVSSRCYFFPVTCLLCFYFFCLASPVNILPALTLPSWLPVWDTGGLTRCVRAAFPLDAKLYSCVQLASCCC